MGYKNLGLIILFVIAFAILSAGFSVTITKKHNYERPEVTQTIESTTYVIKLGSQSHKPKDGQR